MIVALFLRVDGRGTVSSECSTIVVELEGTEDGAGNVSPSSETGGEEGGCDVPAVWDFRMAPFNNSNLWAGCLREMIEECLFVSTWSYIAPGDTLGASYARTEPNEGILDMTTPNQPHHALVVALRDFSRSDRYGFLKTLQVGPLLGDDRNALGELSDRTVEELVLLALQAPDQLSHITSAQERVLTTVLTALSEGGGAAQVIEAPEIKDSDEDSSTVTGFNSVKCELDLRERLARLKIHPQFSRVENLPLKHFWDPSCASSPFEETLTLNQLMGLDITVLSKKRTMTESRFVSMTKALDHALAALDRPVASRETLKTEAPVRQVAVVSDGPWRDGVEGLSPVQAALVDAFSRGVAEVQGEVTPFEESLVEFSHSFSASEFLAVFSGDSLSQAATQRLARWAKAPALAQTAVVLKAAFSSPGVHLSTLTLAFKGEGGPDVFYALGGVLWARALGACEVTVGDRRCEGVWTCNPVLLDLVIKEARTRHRKAPAKALLEVCPSMDPFLHRWLSRTLQEAVRPARVSKKGHRKRR